MFIDACALVAIFSKEADAAAYESAIDEAATAWTTAIAVFETVLVLARPEKLGLSVEAIYDILIGYLEYREIELKELGPPQEILKHALLVAVRHGVSRKKLSAFDCFHYAAAKTAGSPILTLDKLLRDTDVPTLP